MQHGFRMTSAYTGIFTPLITPITHEQRPDLASLRRLVRFQLESGVTGLWVMGTSAEFAAFDRADRAAAIESVVDAVGGEVPVIANISDAGTSRAIKHARLAAAAGADAVAATPPYYYPHTQDEVSSHYRAIREAVDVPLYAYNIPQTVRVRIELSTAQALAADGTLSGIKDSQNDLEWFRQLAYYVRSHEIPFVPFVGTRYLIDAALVAGASGAIPSIANAFPELCVGAFEAASRGDLASSAAYEARIMAIEGLASIFSQGSRNAAILGLLKAVLHRRGIIDSPNLMAPLRTPPAAEREELYGKLDDVLRERQASVGV